MQRGTPIHAARSGRVIDVVDRFGPGGPSRAHLPRANFIKVLHEDGTIGLYSHLRKDGVAVGTGHTVGTDDVLSYSGSSGFSTGLHLHSVVYTLDDDLEQRTIKVRFRTSRGAEHCLKAGRMTDM